MAEEEIKNGRPSIYTQELADRITAGSGIYALVIADKIGYIGQAKNIRKRFLQHCSLNQNRGYSKKQIWLREAILGNKLISLKILEETEDLDNREVYWIKEYRKNFLAEFNMSDGGKTLTYQTSVKDTLPWGRKWSPVRKILMGFRDAISTFKRLGLNDKAKKVEGFIVNANEIIRRVGLKKLNLLLWEKYGR